MLHYDHLREASFSMDRQLKIIYHYHSGFSVQVGGTLLVFDYWEGEGRSLSQVGRITPSFLKAFEKIYVFISHAHPDHLDPIVYTWESEGLPITYIVSSDMPVGTRGKRLAPLQEKELSPDVSVKAFQSTDLGVAFLVRAYGMNIFHAGDLNLWHWRQESTLREIEAAENAYYEAIEPIKGERIDLCMFPVDPRQGLMYDAGANHFIPGELHSVQPAACERFPVYTLNRRCWTLLSTENFGPVVQTAVGAFIVGGIVNEHENARFLRGADMGRFELAGSTIVQFFERGRIRLLPEVRQYIERHGEFRVMQGMWIGLGPGQHED